MRSGTRGEKQEEEKQRTTKEVEQEQGEETEEQKPRSVGEECQKRESQTQKCTHKEEVTHGNEWKKWGKERSGDDERQMKLPAHFLSAHKNYNNNTSEKFLCVCDSTFFFLFVEQEFFSHKIVYKKRETDY